MCSEQVRSRYRLGPAILLAATLAFALLASWQQAQAQSGGLLLEDFRGMSFFGIGRSDDGGIAYMEVTFDDISPRITSFTFTGRNIHSNVICGQVTIQRNLDFHAKCLVDLLFWGRFEREVTGTFPRLKFSRGNFVGEIPLVLVDSALRHTFDAAYRNELQLTTARFLEQTAALPAPRAAAAPAKACATATSMTSSVGASLPNPGDRWVYEVREILSRKTYPLTVEARSVSPDNVVDVSRTARETMKPVFKAIDTEISVVQGESVEHAMHRSGAFVTRLASGVISFSPYLQAFQQLKGDERWSEVSFLGVRELSNYNVTARVAGKERISVRGGTFKTTRVAVLIEGGVSPQRIRVELDFWYADEVKRYVKGQARALDGRMSPWPEFDLELISYTPATPC